ncbi:Uncharacterised protein [Legionella pneumophila]|nr:Uncharacterised protein [Legionella pneumophila]
MTITPLVICRRFHTTKIRLWPWVIAVLNCPTSVDPLGINNLLPSKAKISRVVMARTIPASSELIAVSSVAGIISPAGTVMAGWGNRFAETEVMSFC